MALDMPRFSIPVCKPKLIGDCLLQHAYFVVRGLCLAVVQVDDFSLGIPVMPAKALSVRAQNSSPDDTSPISKLRKAKECALKKMTSDSWLELEFIWGVSDAIPKLKSST